jgi:hypothetical protein
MSLATLVCAFGHASERGMGFEAGSVMKDNSESAFRFLDDPKKRKVFTMIGVSGLVVVAIAFLVLIVNSSSYPDELYIDSVAAPVAAQVKRIRMDRPYYNTRVQKKTIEFYKKNEGKTRWLEYKKPTALYRTYVASIEDAAQYGLDPGHYDLQNIVEAVDSLYKNKKRKAVGCKDHGLLSFVYNTSHRRPYPDGWLW